MKTKKYITDSIFKGIVINDELIVALSESKEFKRLGRIQHLGVSDFIYPSATHTRLAHSYGVYWLSKLILDELKPDISLITKRAFMAASLLHDIGHGPLSHNFEQVTDTHHEEFTKGIIQSPDTEIYKIFEEIEPIARKEVIQMLNGNHPLSWTNQLISSEIDIDRIDYLMRDAVHSGTTYGLIDYKWLIRNIIIVDNKLAFKQKALTSIESVLIGRLQMNESIYHNYKNEAYAQLMPFFINRLRQLIKEGKIKQNYSQINPIIRGKNISIDEFLNLDDAVVQNAISKGLNENDELLRNISDHYINRKMPKIVWKNIDKWVLAQNPKTNGTEWCTKIIKQGWSFYKIGSEQEAYIYTLDKKLVKASEVSYILKKIGDQKQLHEENKIGVKLK